MSAWLPRLLAALLLAGLPAGAGAQGEVRTVRIALDPGQYRALVPAATPSRHANLAMAYTHLVGEQAGLVFLPQEAGSSREAMLDVCEQRADLMLLLGPLEEHLCALAASPAYYRGETLVVSRHASPGAPVFAEGSMQRVAVVQGSRYPDWLQAHYPQLQVVAAPDLPGALSAVEFGAVDAAIGLDVLVRPAVRRDYGDTLLLRSAPADLPGTVHLVARAGDQPMLHDIDTAMRTLTPRQHAQVLQALTTQAWRDMPGPAVMLHHYRWELMALGAAVSLLIAGSAWMARARQAAQRSERRQARFIGVMSHEVRNAAQALVTSVDLLSLSTLDRNQRQLVDAARAAGAGLRQLLTHALDYSRMAAGQFRPTLDWHDISQLAHECVAAVRPAVEAKGMSLRLRVEPDPLPPLWTDAGTLRQILNNLLGNALKFTTQGGIEVVVALRPGVAGTELSLVVSDTGIGIPADRQATVFQPFAQAHDTASRALGGAGLGLSICRDMVDALQGHIHLHSTPGKGSRFSVNLPVSCQQAEQRNHTPPLAGCQLLLVEDHALNRAFVARRLAALGASVQACGDGASALRLQTLQAVPVVLIDCDLPDMTGYHLAQALRDLEQAQGRPPALLVALSASSAQSHTRQCRASGMDAVLHKPLDEQQLLAVLGTQADPGDGRSRPEDADDPLRRPFLQSLREESQAMQRARAECDGTALRHHAHRLAGVLRMLGEHVLADTAGDLHELALESADEWSEADRLRGHLDSEVAALTAGLPTSTATGSAATAHAPETRSTPGPGC